MRNILIISLFILPIYVFSQDTFRRWNSFADIDLVFPNTDKVKYSFSDTMKNNVTMTISDKVIYGINYSYNYSFFRKFSVGGITGFTLIAAPAIPVLKIGGVLRYTFIEEYKANIYMQLAGYIPLSNRADIDLGEWRLGFNLPISKGDKYNLTLGVYTSYVSYAIKKPLIYDEIPQLLEHRGVGVSVGVRF